MSTTFETGEGAGSWAGERLSAGILASALLLIVIAASAAAVTIDDNTEIHEGFYLHYTLTNPGITASWEIQVNWTSTMPIDVWVMDSDQFSTYENGTTFTFDVQQSGTSGTVRFMIPLTRLNDEPFELVFDNTLDGPTDPPDNGVDDIATVTVNGETRSAGLSMNETTQAAVNAIVMAVLVGIVVLVIVVVLVVYALTKGQAKTAAGAAAQQAMPGQGQPGTPGYPAQQAAYWAPYQQASVQYPYQGAPVQQVPYQYPVQGVATTPPAPAPGTALCRTCGTALVVGYAACPRCGAPA